MVVLDFLQLVQSPDEERQDLRECIGRASYAGRQAARDHEAVVVLISSTARQNYDAVNKIGRLGKSNFPVKWPGTLVGLGKESGETEYSADCVLALVRDRSVGQLDYAGRKWSWLWLAVAKLRAGPPCWRPLLFDGSRMKEPPPSLVTHYALLHCDRNGYNRNDHPDDTDATDAFEKAWTSADVPAHEQREINQWEEEGRKSAERQRAAEQAAREAAAEDKKGKRGAGNQKRDPKPPLVYDSGTDV